MFGRELYSQRKLDRQEQIREENKKQERELELIHSQYLKEQKLQDILKEFSGPLFVLKLISIRTNLSGLFDSIEIHLSFRKYNS